MSREDASNYFLWPACANGGMSIRYEPLKAHRILWPSFVQFRQQFSQKRHESGGNSRIIVIDETCKDSSLDTNCIYVAAVPMHYEIVKVFCYILYTSHIMGVLFYKLSSNRFIPSFK